MAAAIIAPSAVVRSTFSVQKPRARTVMKAGNWSVGLWESNAEQRESLRQQQGAGCGRTSEAPPTLRNRVLRSPFSRGSRQPKQLGASRCLQMSARKLKALALHSPASPPPPTLSTACRLPGSDTPAYLESLPASYGFDPLGLGQ